MMGIEWIVDAYGCSSDRLRDLRVLQSLFARMIADLDLHPCGDARWHQFEASGGITGMVILSESHLACHTFPELGVATFNLYCCRPRSAWPWERQLSEQFGAAQVSVRCVSRGGTAMAAERSAVRSAVVGEGE